MPIRRYTPADEAALMRLIREEGEAWACYTAPDVAAKYQAALKNSLTYVAEADGALCGYVRALDDHGFYLYICDLLVAQPHRRRGLGQQLMERLCLDYPAQVVYVMSDADGFYEGKGYHREGSVFEVTPPGK